MDSEAHTPGSLKPRGDDALVHLLSLFLIVLGFAVYGFTLKWGFIIDDWGHLSFARNSHGLRGFLEIFRPHGDFYRPFPDLFYFVNLRLFGPNPLIYRVELILAFSLINIMILHLGRLLTGSVAYGAFAALCNVFSMIHEEEISCITGILSICTILFAVVSIYYYVSYKRKRAPHRLALSLVFFALSALCKEACLTLPAVLLVYDLLWNDSRLEGTGRRILASLRSSAGHWLFAYLFVFFLAIPSLPPMNGPLGKAMFGQNVSARDLFDHVRDPGRIDHLLYYFFSIHIRTDNLRVLLVLSWSALMSLTLILSNFKARRLIYFGFATYVIFFLPGSLKYFGFLLDMDPTLDDIPMRTFLTPQLGMSLMSAAVFWRPCWCPPKPRVVRVAFAILASAVLAAHPVLFFQKREIGLDTVLSAQTAAITESVRVILKDVDKGSEIVIRCVPDPWYRNMISFYFPEKEFEVRLWDGKSKPPVARDALLLSVRTEPEIQVTLGRLKDGG